MGVIRITTTATSLTAPAVGSSSGSLTNSQQSAALMQALRGAPGPSAYEVAVANGYQGTQAQWLASLTPPPAAETEVPDLTLIFENQLI